MPREVVHWCVLDRTLENVSKREAFRGLFGFKEYRYATVWGAMAHDYPYFDGYGSGPHVPLGEILHGTQGDDPFSLLLKPASVLIAQQEADGYLWGAWLGMLSHYVTDTNLHPLVYYFTGNYHDKDPEKKAEARIQHRLFEVYLDAHVRSFYTPPLGGLFKNIADCIPVSKITEFLDTTLTVKKIRNRYDFKPGKPDGAWRRSFKYASFCQKHFLSTFSAYICRFLEKRNPERYRPIEAMFAAGRSTSIFSDPLKYRNLVTGADRENTIENLIEKSVRETTELFLLAEPLITGETKDVESVFSCVKGRSLSVGLAGKTEADIKFLSPEPLNLTHSA